MNIMPLVSVVMPTYNGSVFIKKAISSVLSQSFTDWEFLIIDDGSTDETKSIIQDYVIKDNRFKYFSQQHKGVGCARQFGLKMATGKYVAFLDDDDEWVDNDKLFSQIYFFNKNQDYVLVGGHKTIIVDESGKAIKNYFNPMTDMEIRKQILLKNCFVTSSVMFNREAAISVGGFYDQKVSEDYDMWLRLGSVGKMANLDTFTVRYLVRKTSISSKKRLELYKTNLALVNKYKTKYPNYFLGIIKSYFRLVYYYLTPAT